MHKKRKILLILLVLVLVAAVFLPTAEVVDWWAFGGGGGSLSQGGLVLDGVLGQGVVGAASQAGVDLCSGYLCSQARSSLFLPVAIR